MMKKITVVFNILIVIISIFLGIKLLNENGLYDSLINFSIIPVLLFPYILKKYIKLSDISILIYSLYVFLALFLGSILDFYNTINWWDTFAHTLFGFLFSFFALEFIAKNHNSKKIIINSLFIFSLIAVGAGLWETFEFTCDKIFSKDAQRVILTGVNDTMKDMIVAYLGSLVFIFLYSAEHMYNKKGLIKKFINNF